MSRVPRSRASDGHPGPPSIDKKQQGGNLPSMNESDLLAQGLVKVVDDSGVTHWTNPKSPLDKSMKGNFATITHQSTTENKP